VEADEHARGWRALIAFDLRDPDDEPLTVTYCPDYAGARVRATAPRATQLVARVRAGRSSPVAST
jgi:hypothetical protein